MLGKRPLRLEALESRKLLAADCLATDGEPPEDIGALESVMTAEGEEASIVQVAPDGLFGWHGPYNSAPPDLVQEHGNTLYVVDQDPYSSDRGTLLVFERLGDGSLERLERVELGFAAQRMIVAGDQVVLFGRHGGFAFPAEIEHDRVVASDHPLAVVATVNIGEQVEVIRQDLRGQAVEIHHDGDQVAVVTTIRDGAIIAIYPPPPITGALTTYDITSDGLREVASREIELFGQSHLHQRDFTTVSHTYPDFFQAASDGVQGDASLDGIRAPDGPVDPIVHWSRYVLGEDSIERVDSLELGVGFVTDYQVAPDGLSAVAVRGEFASADPTTHIDLLDLSGETARVFESIELPEISGRVLLASPDYVVLQDYRNNGLVTVDANQQIDVAAENRVRRIDLPESLQIGFDSLQLTEDWLIVPAWRSVEHGESDSEIERPAVYRAPESILLTISLSEGRVIADSRLRSSAPSPIDRLVLIDTESRRFGMVAPNYDTASGDSYGQTQFFFGHLDADGEFDRDGSLPAARWLEIDADPERLIARRPESLIEYDWQPNSEPVETPFGERRSVLEAVDDEFTLQYKREDQLIDVLANDVIRHAAGKVEIVELIGAPRNAGIYYGEQILVSSDWLTDGETLRLEYVISDGLTRSTAAVEIIFEPGGDEGEIDPVYELINAVRQRAAEDFNVIKREAWVSSYDKIFDEPLLVENPDTGEQVDLSPGVLVTLSIKDMSVQYAASRDGQIIHLHTEQHEKLVDFGLRAIDDNGETLEEVTEGDSFWIEFNSDDLRMRGQGLFQAYIDLAAPSEHLVFTGPVEIADDYNELIKVQYGEGGVEYLGAVGSIFTKPGPRRHEILRIGVKAVGAGEVTLQPEPSEGLELLLHGIDYDVPVEQARYAPLQLTIAEPPAEERFDADGNGEITAGDALRVLNFLGRHGSMGIDELESIATRDSASDEQAVSVEVRKLSRYDSNRNGIITALDALVIINVLGQESRDDGLAMAAPVDSAVDTSIDDDEKDGNGGIAELVDTSVM